MTVTQISACPVRIRIENETNGTQGNGGGHDFALASLGEDYAVFLKVPADPVSQPPADTSA